MTLGIGIGIGFPVGRPASGGGGGGGAVAVAATIAASAALAGAAPLIGQHVSALMAGASTLDGTVLRGQQATATIAATAGLTATATLDFNPAVLSLSGYLRASYSSAPWLGIASAGTSGTHDFTEVANPPSVGAALNGFTPADFNGSTQLLTGAVPTDFVSTSVGGIAVLFRTRTTTITPAATGWQNGEAMLADSLARLGLLHTDDGLFGAFYNGAARNMTGPLACTTNAWHLGFQWWNGGTMFLQLDGGTPISVAMGGSGGPVFAGGTLRLGRNNGAGTFYDGLIAHALIQNAAWTAQNILDIRAHINSRYGLSL